MSLKLPRHRLVRIGACLIILAAAATAAAQRGYRLMEGPNFPPRFPPADFEDGRFTVCKVMYTSDRYEEMGVGWATDYPYAGINLMIRLSELTKTPVSIDKAGEPNYWVVRLTDPALFRCPFTIASDVGTMHMSPAEVANLRAYLLKGGFLWVDDFWGTAAWMQWSSEIHRALPEYEIQDIPPGHPLFHTMFEIDHTPQVTNIQFWRRNRGVTQERGSDSPRANLRAITDEHGRILVLMTHNTDIGDSWEREGEDPEFFLEFSPNGYALGINALLYGMTH